MVVVAGHNGLCYVPSIAHACCQMNEVGGVAVAVDIRQVSLQGPS